MASVLLRCEVGCHTPWATISSLMNTKKSQFLSAVRILAQNDSFILDLAECVREEALPDYPGGAALRFVAAVSRLCCEPALQEAKPQILTCHGAQHLPPPVRVPIRHLCHGR